MSSSDDKSSLSRRDLLAATSGAAIAMALPGCGSDKKSPSVAASAVINEGRPSAVDPILSTARLGPGPWPTLDPFLFCVHHHDAYPAGNESLGPVASLAGRNIGQDFAGVDGWNMYHGEVVPGFPQHPHRGFETVTVVRRGFVDHSDSLGATARYGDGDAQWLTAGAGVVHAEMFPLVKREQDNPLELFQLWLNLPKASKFADPHFSMFWSDTIPTEEVRDAAGRKATVRVVAGSFGASHAPPPPPQSWAARADSDVAIWTIALEAGAKLTLPAARTGTNRMLYLFEGASVGVANRSLTKGTSARLIADVHVELENGDAPAQLLLLQGRPIGEPVAHHGPFVMNTREELEQAFADYRRTQFGGWPWPSHGPVHSRDKGRFAIHADGREEKA